MPGIPLRQLTHFLLGLPVRFAKGNTGRCLLYCKICSKHFRAYCIAHVFCFKAQAGNQEQVIPSAEARELLAQLAATPLPDPGDTMQNRVPRGGEDVERVLAHVGVFAAEGQKYVIGAMLDQPLPGYYTPETARRLVAELEQKVSIQ